jgi:GTPase SAR1 family protein
VDINSARTLQTATEKLFQAVSKYASDVPIIVVATKKDDLYEISFGARRKARKKEGLKFDEEDCEQYAEEKVQERIETIRNEMLSVPDGRLDACVAVSHGTITIHARLSWKQRLTPPCRG